MNIDGVLKINPFPDVFLAEFLQRFNLVPRAKRKVPEYFGTDGEFYIGKDEECIEIGSDLPNGQPGRWNCWSLSSLRILYINKFYTIENSIKWLVYLTEAILYPLGYSLEGNVIFFNNSITKQFIRLEVIGSLINFYETDFIGSTGKRTFIKIKPRKEKVNLNKIFEKEIFENEERPSIPKEYTLADTGWGQAPVYQNMDFTETEATHATVNENGEELFRRTGLSEIRTEDLILADISNENRRGENND